MVSPDPARSPGDPLGNASRITLVLGGARSGKSAFAERLALSCAPAGERVYLATGEAGDDEMAARIARHRARRGAEWRCVEEPVELAEALAREARGNRVVLVDCLTLWISNLMAHGRDVEAESIRLADLLPSLAGPAVLVANEVGLGIVPDNPAARAFRDHAGRLNRLVAGAADRVEFIAAGLPLTLKHHGT